LNVARSAGFIFLADPFASIMDDLNEGAGFRSQAFVRARRHSRIVAVLKFALPLSALTVVAGFGLVAMEARMVPDVDLAGLALQDGKIVMNNPKMNGVTGDNQPYTVEAVRALQSVSDVNDIELEQITARIPFGSGAIAEVLAPIGHLDNTKQVLTLSGGFDLKTSDGMVAKLKDAVFDFEGRSLKTAMPVDITRFGTHIQADSMIISDGGARLVFEKRVRMTLQPDHIENAKVP
jgi:lipopolysaccharide export system protein LptC